MFSEIS